MLTHRVALFVNDVSIDSRLVAQRRDQSSSPKEPNRSSFLDVDDDGVIGFSPQDERDHAVTTCVVFAAPTAIALNGDVLLHDRFLSRTGVHPVCSSDSTIIVRGCNSGLMVSFSHEEIPVEEPQDSVRHSVRPAEHWPPSLSPTPRLR